MSQANVLDNNHGIERVVRDKTSYGVAYTSGEPEVKFLPWYIKIIGRSRSGYVTRYYTRISGWERVECNTWEAAYNHIARSRGLPTSKQVGSNYVQEARNAGVLPETQAQSTAEQKGNSTMSFTSYDMHGYVDERDGKLEIVGDTSETPEVVGYLYCDQFICVFCVEQEFSGEMDAFFADKPTPLTAEEAMARGYTQCDFSEHHKQDVSTTGTQDEWYHPRYDDMAESQPEWDM